jgi:formylglycine-generating enzyme required for sulfatase activity
MSDINNCANNESELPKLIPLSCDKCGWELNLDHCNLPDCDKTHYKLVEEYLKRADTTKINLDKLKRLEEENIILKKQYQDALRQNVSDEDFWNECLANGTIASYQDYINHCPNGKYYLNAKKEIDRLSNKIEPQINKFKDTISGAEFIYVKSGNYQMGDIFGDGQEDEKPVHEVHIDNFYMGKYPITQRQWMKVMGSNPSYFRNDGDNCPIEMVSWNNVQEFINKLNSQTEGQFRLPTEAEWEYAARSGGKKEKYSGSINPEDVAWYSENSEDKTHPVGQKKPNSLGIYDMCGNVREWIQDSYDNTAYNSHGKKNPICSTGSGRIVRGGCWHDTADNIRSTYRSCHTSEYRFNYVGFRLVYIHNLK